ncbi:MAG TPA: SigE family RNA polymerase sigma factor [Streptosporangiaceae bacterium]|nr:SigE family RNA polymerase sigma factor [Streptosporangiaceae bacterium]
MTAEEEFAEFVGARERVLQRSAWMLTGDWALAEDLVQTALARCWLRWEKITRRDDPEIYVRRAMLNTWLTWRRRRWRAETATAELPDSPAPGDMASEVATRQVVRQLMDSLTDRQRIVLVLRVVDDLSQAQVAQILNCPIGTVKSTMSQALVRLRDDSRLAELMERKIK